MKITLSLLVSDKNRTFGRQHAICIRVPKHHGDVRSRLPACQALPPPHRPPRATPAQQPPVVPFLLTWTGQPCQGCSCMWAACKGRDGHGYKHTTSLSTRRALACCQLLPSPLLPDRFPGKGLFAPCLPTNCLPTLMRARRVGTLR